MRAGKAWRTAWLIAAIVAAPIAHADYKDSYARGLKAYRDGDVANARTLMQQALSEHPEAAAKIRLYGQVYEPYLPQHYLGLIAFKQGDCAGALSLWNSAANKAILAEVPDAAGEQQRDGATCASKVAVVKKEDKPPEPAPSTPVKPAEPPPKPVVKTSPPPAPPVVKPVPVEKPPAVVAKNEPPQPLVQAFEDYLAGHYADVARINADSYADTHARFHAYLVRAAAKFTLGTIGGENTLLDAARADARAAKAIDGSTSPDASLFSPSFRRFYDAAR